MAPIKKKTSSLVHINWDQKRSIELRLPVMVMLKKAEVDLIYLAQDWVL